MTPPGGPRIPLTSTRWRGPRTAVLVPVVLGLLLAGAWAAAVPAGPPPPDSGGAVVGHHCGADRHGCEAWVARYDGFGALDDAGAIAVSPDGSVVFTTGHSNGPDDYDGAVLAYDATSGVERWRHRLDGPLHGFDEATAIAVSHDGATVFAAGYSEGGPVGDDGFLAALDAVDGQLRWVTRYDGPASADDFVQAMAQSPDGARVFLVGPSTGVGTGYDLAVLAFQAVDGALVWASRHDGPGHGHEFGYDLAVTRDGATVVAVGSSPAAAGHTEQVVVAVDAATGGLRWLHRAIGGAGTHDEARALALAPDGSRAYVVGGIDVVEDRGHASVAALDMATGQHVWGRVVDEPGVGRAVDVMLSPDGARLYLTASVRGREASSAITTLALRALDGATLWKAIYEGPVPQGRDEPFALALSPSGDHVFVTGWSLSWLPVGVYVPFADVGAGAAMDIVTLAYATDRGTLAWEVRYRGPGHDNDQGRALAVAPGGARLFVAGYSHGGASGYDYATLAYDLPSPLGRGSDGGVPANA